MGVGKYGTCCAEMDIWEANSMATAYTPHTCDPDITQYRCEGTDCGDNASGERYDGVCDKDGCDINPFRMGNPDFYGRGEQYTVNTLQKMTLVTQFITNDGTDNGDLVEIKRFYVQDDKIIHSPASTILEPAGLSDSDSITDQFCEDKKILFEDVNDFKEKGGMKGMGDSLDRGQVLALSLWDDVEVNMLWLDSAYPLNKDSSEPGVLRGECPGGVSSTPTYLRDTYPDGYVIFENAAIGEIGSTLQKVPTPSPTPAPCDFCGPRPGVNEPECGNKPYADCMNMINNEGKCAWNECQNPPPAPTPTPPAPTPPAPTPPTPTPPTPTPPTPPGECKSWCASNTAPWESKCSWIKCSTCTQCDSMGPSPTKSPTTAPTDSPSKAPVESPVSSSMPTLPIDENDDDEDISDDLETLLEMLLRLMPLLTKLLDLLKLLGLAN